MLSSLTQLRASEPLALVGTAVAEPDERELGVAQRHVVVSHTFLDRICTDIMQHSPAARTWLKLEQRP
jgi:hypothetical protein